MSIYEYVFDDVMIWATRDDIWMQEYHAIGRVNVLFVSRLFYSEARDLYYRSATYDVGDGGAAMIPSRIEPLVEHIEVEDFLDNQAAVLRLQTRLQSLRRISMRQTEYLDKGEVHGCISNSSPESTVLDILGEWSRRNRIEAAKALEGTIVGLESRIYLTVCYVTLRHACNVVSALRYFSPRKILKVYRNFSFIQPP